MKTCSTTVPAPKLDKEVFTKQIKKAMNTSKTEKGVLSGNRADLSVALLAGKYMKLFNTPLEAIYDSVDTNTYLSDKDKSFFKQAVYDYFCLSKIPSKTDPHFKQDVLRRLLYSKTIYLLSRMEYISYNKGASCAADKKRNVKAIAQQLWIANGKKRGFDEAVRLQTELQNQGIKRSAKTIYDWICMW